MMVAPRLVAGLGAAQLVCWGVSYYLMGVFGEDIARDLGWSRTMAYGGFAGAVALMGVISPLVGALVDRHGGRRIMTIGSGLMAAGLLGLSQAREPFSYFAAWTVMGLAMRMTLYDAAFAALVRISGPAARASISQITLLGGLASSVFWPFGHFLADAFGWRGALVVYAGLAAATALVHWTIPDRHYEDGDSIAAPAPPLARAGRDQLLAAALYAGMVTLASFLSTGMSAHMIGIMSGLGMSAAAAVWVATLRGIGQSSARLCEIAFGGRLSPLTLGLLATVVLPFSFMAGTLSGVSIAAGVVFGLVYGGGNGLLTIVRGTLPLVLFDPRRYGALVGRLASASFFASALAPVAYAGIIDAAGDAAALHVSAVVAVLVAAAALALRWRFHGDAAAGASAER
jgi:predicted MFS family arabinose efflux permease